MKRFAIFAAVLAAALGVAGAAQAFTFEDQGSVSNGDGTRSAITDPDQGLSRLGSGGATNDEKPRLQDRSGIYFGPAAQRSFNQRYDTRHLFDPLGRPGDTR